jgi:membrane-bound metal-dependent hydrolase YbcI (DUF457 family)
MTRAVETRQVSDSDATRQLAAMRGCEALGIPTMSSRTHSGKMVSAVQPLNHHGTGRLTACLGALLAYAPFGWWIADAYPAFAVAGGIVAVGVAGIPDKLSPWIIPDEWTHSLLGAAAVGGLVAASGWVIADHIVIYAGSQAVTPGAAAQYGFAVGLLAAEGHILADGLTATDVRPLWPVSERGGSLDLPALVDPRNNKKRINLVGTIVVVALTVAVMSSTVTATML